MQWTYATLTTALQDWPVARSTDYIANIPNAIGLGELRLYRDLGIEYFDEEMLQVIILGNKYVNKPADLIATRTLGYGGTPQIRITEDDAIRVTEDNQVRVLESSIEDAPFTYLELRSFDWCRMYGPDDTVRAPPENFTEVSDVQWMLVPVPDDDYLMMGRMIHRPPQLSAAYPTTWLSLRLPDLLFACCLMESEQYVKADDRYADYKTKYYQELLPSAISEFKDSIRRGIYTPVLPAAAPIRSPAQ